MATRAEHPPYGDQLMVPRVLKQLGMLCFDLRTGDEADAAPWALKRDHPLDADQYMKALLANDRAGAARNAHWRKRGASFDDLACVNVDKVANVSLGEDPRAC